MSSGLVPFCEINLFVQEAKRTDRCEGGPPAVFRAAPPAAQRPAARRSVTRASKWAELRSSGAPFPTTTSVHVVSRISVLAEAPAAKCAIVNCAAAVSGPRFALVAAASACDPPSAPCTPRLPLARALHFPHATVAAVRTCCGQPREAPAKRHARSAAPKAHQPRGARWFAAARSALLARVASTAPCPPLPAPSAIRPQRACAAGSDERDRSALSHPVVDLNLVARARPSSR